MNLVEQYKRGIRGHAILVLEELFHEYLEVEEQFHGDAFDKAVLSLRQRMLSELEGRTKQRGSSTSIAAVSSQVRARALSSSTLQLQLHNNRIVYSTVWLDTTVQSRLQPTGNLLVLRIMTCAVCE